MTFVKNVDNNLIHNGIINCDKFFDLSSLADFCFF